MYAPALTLLTVRERINTHIVGFVQEELSDSQEDAIRHGHDKASQDVEL